MDATSTSSSAQSQRGKHNDIVATSALNDDGGTMNMASPDVDDEDWEEWDGKSPFWVHCVAGSLAGVVEHTAVYPLDTVRTHIQVACSACAQLHKRGGGIGGLGAASSSNGGGGLKGLLSSVGAKPLSSGGAAAAAGGPNLPMGMVQTIRHLMNEPVAAASATAAAAPPSTAAGWVRLWRGVETMVVGCIPAHALYFSSYEIVKAAFTSRETGQVSPLGSSLAGGAAVVSHDLIMTPLDTIKQRMQLGHYSSVRAAVSRMAQSEGVGVFYRSFPVTLASNVPYGMIMVSVNEHLKQTIDLFEGGGGGPEPGAHHPWKTVVLSSSAAGLVASAATTPLDRIKTALQTQHLLPTCYRVSTNGISGGTSSKCLLRTHANWREAALHILETEGYRGFFRGIVPRVLSHTPAVAISWTTYETAKQFLMKNYP